MIYGIQALRGIAVLLVVLGHVEPQALHLGTTPPHWLNDGHYGVDIFFVISGFIIWATSQRPDFSLATFAKLRVIRIVPLYWAVTGLIVLVSLAAPSMLSSTRFDFAHVLASFLFVPHSHPVLGSAFPVLVPGWTLNCEAYFYAVFGIGLLLPSRLFTALLTAAVLFAVVVFGAVAHPEAVPLQVYASPILLEFMLGLAVGVLHTHAPAPPATFGAAALVLGAIGFGLAVLVGPSDSWTEVATIGGSATLAVWGCSILKRRHRDKPIPVLHAIGDASYSIYLVQVIALPVAAKVWALAGPGFGSGRLALFILFDFAAAVLAGMLVHRLVERPVLGWLRRRFEAAPVRAASPLPLRPLPTR